MSIFLTFNYVNLSFIFFRADNFESAFTVIKGMLFLNNNKDIINLNIPISFIIAFAMAFLICFLFKNTYYILDKLQK